MDKARDYVEAYNARDFDRATKWFAPAVEWILPERQGFDSCVGEGPIRRFWEGLDETFDELQLLPQEWVDAGDRIATRLRHRILGKGSGVALEDVLYHQVITFADGWMVRLEYFADWEDALRSAHAPTPAPAQTEGGAGPARAR
jgi:SnoaL-like protein